MTNKKSFFNYLTPEQIQKKVDFINFYIGSDNNASASLVDPNSNVSEKNMGTLKEEMYKFENIQVSRKIIKDKITEMFGDDLADQYEEDIESHLLYCHDETLAAFLPYCASVTMYPFLLNGTKCLGGTSKAPKNLQSFCGSFVNLVYQLATNWAGATATVEFLMYFDYFARKQYGDNYLAIAKDRIAQELQGVVYALNQPAAARGNQSVFWNISVFDKYYFDSIFGGFRFPDGSQPDYDSLSRLQKFFMEWFREERKKELLTYPVLTAAVLLDEDKKPKDGDFAWFIAEEMSKGLSFFIYESQSADSLASCCFDANQRVLVRNEDGVKLIRIGDFKPMSNLTIFFDGSWVKGSFVKATPTDKMYRIVTSNKKEVFCTSNHIFPTMDGDKRADEITTDDWLMFNDRAYKEGSGEYKDGFLIGMYLGDGSIYEREKCNSVEVTLSLNEDKVKKCIEYLPGWHLYSSKNNVVFAKTADKNIAEFIKYWVKGSRCNTKELNMDVCNKSLDFRRGILDGFYATDGGNSNKIYTTSKKLAEQMEAMLTTMGIQTILDVSDRTNEKVVVRGEEFTRNFPLYCIRWYEPKNKRSMGDVYKITINGTFFKVSEVQEITNYDEPVYCFNMADGKEPYFTLANGIQTHNCRLRNELADNTFSYTLGAGGVSTGSFRVITINMNRYVQQYEGKLPFGELISRIHKYLAAHRAVIKRYIELGMLPAYTAQFINFDTQFGTIGINGMLEAMEYKGFSPTVDKEAYQQAVSKYLKVIYDLNKADRAVYGFRFNTEHVPAEGLGVKNAQWDKHDGLFVPRDCYNSYFFPVEDDSLTILDKMFLHGKETTKYLDGGSACHLNIAQLFSKTQAYDLLCVAGKLGVNYWTYNCLVTICNDCGYINVNTEDCCTECGSCDVDYGTRVIGYLKRISSYSKERQLEAARRFYVK